MLLISDLEFDDRIYEVLASFIEIYDCDFIIILRFAFHYLGLVALLLVSFLFVGFSYMVLIR